MESILGFGNRIIPLWWITTHTLAIKKQAPLQALLQPIMVSFLI